MDRGSAFMSCDVILFLRLPPNFRMQIHMLTTCYVIRNTCNSMIWFWESEDNVA